MGKLRSRGHEVVAASPATGVNSLTGEGLAEALAGAEVLVDVSNSPSFEDKAVLDFFKTSSHNLLSAEAAAGVRHHVALSVLSPAMMQPIASEDVATVLADVTLAAPANGTLEVAGPDKRPLVDFVGKYLAASKDPREVIIDPKTAYFGVVLDDSSLTPDGGARIMPTHFEDWLAQSLSGSR